MHYSIRQVKLVFYAILHVDIPFTRAYLTLLLSRKEKATYGEQPSFPLFAGLGILVKNLTCTTGTTGEISFLTQYYMYISLLLETIFQLFFGKEKTTYGEQPTCSLFTG